MGRDIDPYREADFQRSFKLLSWLESRAFDVPPNKKATQSGCTFP